MLAARLTPAPNATPILLAPPSEVAPLVTTVTAENYPTILHLRNCVKETAATRFDMRRPLRWPDNIWRITTTNSTNSANS